MRKKVLFLALILALVFSVSTQQGFTEENANYVYPIIETNCDQINATTYRFYPGDTLNFTFTTSGSVYAYYPKNYTTNVETEYPPGYVTSTDFARFYWFESIDGSSLDHSVGYMIASDGCSLGYMRFGFHNAGEHTIKIVYRFKGYGDYKGYFEMNFHSERKLRLEEINSTPIPMIPLLVSGVSGAVIAFVVSAVIWHKRKSAKKEEKQC